MTDRQLLKRLRRDDKKSFDELFERYYDRCYAYAAALVKDTAATEDIIQNVFLKIWTGRGRIDISKPFINYLMTAVRNESLSWLRLRANSPERTELCEIEDNSSDILDNIFGTELDARLTAIVGGMPPQRRTVFEMSRFYGMSISEIASKLNLSPRTVERHLSLALKDIRKTLS